MSDTTPTLRQGAQAMRRDHELAYVFWRAVGIVSAVASITLFIICTITKE